jgi:hypothetical protein
MGGLVRQGTFRSKGNYAETDSGISIGATGYYNLKFDLDLPQLKMKRLALAISHSVGQLRPQRGYGVGQARSHGLSHGTIPLLRVQPGRPSGYSDPARIPDPGRGLQGKSMFDDATDECISQSGDEHTPNYVLDMAIVLRRSSRMWPAKEALPEMGCA